MNSLFAFRCYTNYKPLPQSTLIVFSGPTTFSQNDLTSTISDETKGALSPEVIYLLYPEEIATNYSENLKNNNAFLPLMSDTEITLWSYNGLGEIKFRELLRGDKKPDSLPKNHICRQGLTELFVRRGGVLEAGPSAHFIKPSGRLDSRFLRAAHALSEGSEIFFAAFWLLPFLSDKVKYIQIDTSSIASIVYAALLMRKPDNLPVVTTFHSYAGMDKSRFSRDRTDIVLISASQSGEMAREICSMVREPEKVITLFSTAEGALAGEVLCNLNWHKLENVRGLNPPAPIVKANDSRPIRIIGEHFITELEAPRVLVPSVNHVPDIVTKVFSKIKGRKVFSCNRNVDGKTFAIWLNVDALFGTQEFNDWIENLVVKDIPATTHAIVNVRGEEQGNCLGKKINDEIENKECKLVSCDATSLEKIETECDSTGLRRDGKVPIVIVGNVAGNGESLLEVSRELRRWAPNSHRIFVSAVSITSSPKALSLLRSNLCHGGHKFQTMFDIIVDRYRISESWNLERDLYQESDGDGLPPTLSQRLECLNSKDGLIDNLFLDGKSVKLSIRNNFAFWPEIQSSGASQADVFVTVSVVLENMRSGSDVEIGERLINSANNQSIISAETFHRYNDGVIQAALLRCAYPVELDYRDSPEESKKISSMLCGMCKMVDKSQGEALAEFFLALILYRLKLCNDDRDRVFLALKENNDNFNEEQKWLADKLLDS
jgi:hypothetical protein